MVKLKVNSAYTLFEPPLNPLYTVNQWLPIAGRIETGRMYSLVDSQNVFIIVSEITSVRFVQNILCRFTACKRHKTIHKTELRQLVCHMYMLIEEEIQIGFR
jgi:hypothetical protein